MVLEK
jgi:hypothetical protein